MQPKAQQPALRPLTNIARSKPRLVKDGRRSRRGRCMFHALAYALLASSTLYWSYRACFSSLPSAIPVEFDVPVILPVIGGSESTIGAVGGGATASSEYFRPSLPQEDEASSIVRRAYEHTYAHIVPCDDGDCTLKGLACWQKTLDFFQPRKRKSWHHEDDFPDGSGPFLSKDGASNVPSIPWWFQTFLCDLQYNNAFGQWHELSTANPPLQFCAIEKVSSSAWSEAFCNLNPKSTSVECAFDTELGKEVCHEHVQCDYTSEELLNEENDGTMYPRAVFLRDPLERLLSAFINKCYNAIEENHCEPSAIFNSRHQRPWEITDYSGDGEEGDIWKTVISKCLLPTLTSCRSSGICICCPRQYITICIAISINTISSAVWTQTFISTSKPWQQGMENHWRRY